MGKAPAFQLYPGDVFREPGLKCVGLNVRGAWYELLMVMWDCTPQGKKESTLEGFARLWRTTLEEAAFIIDQLETERIAEIEFFDEDCKNITRDFADYYRGLSPKCPDLSPESPVYITITNRRMFKEWNTKEYERLKKQRQRGKLSVPPSVPEKSPSYSSSSSSSSSSLPKDKESKSHREGPKKPDPHIKEFIDFYYQSFQDKFFGQKPAIEHGKDGALVKGLLKIVPFEELKDLLIKFLDSDDPFILKSGYTIGAFKSQINKLRINNPKISPEDMWEITKKEQLRRQNEEGGHNPIQIGDKQGKA
jgi:hypothetical protein